VRDGVLVHAHDRGDLAVGHALGGQQHHPSSLGRALGRGVGADPALQLNALDVGDRQWRDGRHGSGLLVVETSNHHMPTTNAELH